MSEELQRVVIGSPLPQTIKVAIIEDRREIREGLAMLIGGTDGYSCVGTFPTMEDAIARIHHNLPQVVLVDIGLPGMSGIEGIAILKERHPELALLMLSVYDDDERIFKALCAGACGYLLKKTPPARLLESIREVIAGGAPALALRCHQIPSSPPASAAYSWDASLTLAAPARSAPGACSSVQLPLRHRCLDGRLQRRVAARPHQRRAGEDSDYR